MPASTSCLHCFRQYALAGALNTHIAQQHPETLEETLDHRPPDSTILHYPDPDPDTRWDSNLESDGDILKLGGVDDSSRDYPPEYWPGSGAPLSHVPGYDDHQRDDWDPWAPFSDAQEWRLARWLIETKTTKTKINEYFNSGMHSSSAKRSFQSAHTLDICIDRMPGSRSLPQWQHGSINPKSYAVPGSKAPTASKTSQKTQFYYPDIVACARYHLSQFS